jgi:hypothetical protein
MTAPQAPRGDDPQRPEASLRPLLAVLAVAGLGAAAVLLHPSTGLTHSSADPLLGAFLPMLLLIAGWVALVQHLRGRFKARGDDSAPTLRAERLTDAVRVLLPLAGLLVPAALIALFFSRRQPSPGIGDHPALTPGEFVTVKPVQVDPPDVSSPHFPLPHILGPLLLALLVAGAVVAAVLVLRQLRARPRRAVPADRPVELAEQLVEAVEQGRRALTGTDARAAVIACYAAMEDSLAESGVARRTADSPTDLLERAVAAGTVRRSDAGALTALFREARYSRHPMGEAELSRARAALDGIAAHLAARASEGAR